MQGWKNRLTSAHYFHLPLTQPAGYAMMGETIENDSGQKGIVGGTP
jgi:hypothetical protein